MINISLLLLLTSPLSEASPPSLASPFSLEPLAEPSLAPEEVLVQVTSFNNWLVDSYADLPPEKLPSLREHLYYLIDAELRLRANDRAFLPPESPDLLLAMLFSWAEPLGVYGGNLVYNSLRAEGTVEQAPRLPVPDGFSVELHGDLLQVRSTTNPWSFQVPFYFMLFELRSIETRDGASVDMAVVATGTSKHSDRPGHSQATLMFLYSPESPHEDFDGFWAEQLGLTGDSKKVDLGTFAATSRSRVDPKSKMRIELVSWPNSDGAAGVVFMGLPGPYEANRVHFLQFLELVQVPTGHVADSQATSASSIP